MSRLTNRIVVCVLLVAGCLLPVPYGLLAFIGAGVVYCLPTEVL